MEKIQINAITKKDSGLVIVNYNDNKEATLNAKWQSQQIDYLEKDVGLGGQCVVEIVKKGEYTNITKVDFNSAVKGVVNDVVSLIPITHITKPNRDNSIVCQCLLKIAGDLGDYIPEDPSKYGQVVNERMNELVGAYKLGLSLLE